MVSAATFVTALVTTTEPDAVRVPDPDIVSPGFAGFMTVFLIAVATVLLIRSMTKHMRNAKFMADEIARQEQEQDPAAQGSAGAPPSQR